MIKVCRSCAHQAVSPVDGHCRHCGATPEDQRAHLWDQLGMSLSARAVHDAQADSDDNPVFSASGIRMMRWAKRAFARAFDCRTRAWAAAHEDGPKRLLQ